MHKPDPKTKPEHDIAQEFKDYAYIVSHDLGAPVRAMVEFSKLLAGERGSQLSDEAREFLSIIVENGVHLQNMMSALLDYSRLDTMAKPYTKVDCNMVVKFCQNQLQGVIAAKKAALDIGPLPVIDADAEQITKLFAALLDNALKFQAEGARPEIKVRVEDKSGYWQFSVSDNGIGIDARHMEKIFKLFQRLHSQEEYPGCGAGLTLAQKIVHRHHGVIACTSQSGKGSTFTFTLPK